MLTGTDILNIVCFIIVMLISVGTIAVIIKMKIEGIWIFQLIWVLLMDILGVMLLISRVALIAALISKLR
jgi:hypothetical protein